MCLEGGRAKSMTGTTVQQRGAFDSADIAQGAKVLMKPPQAIEEEEKLLINEKQTAGGSILEAMICEKAKMLRIDLLTDRHPWNNC